MRLDSSNFNLCDQNLDLKANKNNKKGTLFKSILALRVIYRVYGIG